MEGSELSQTMQNPSVFSQVPSPRESQSLVHFRAVFHSLAVVAEYGEPAAEGHVTRVSAYTSFLAAHVLGESPREAERVGVAALLHDIGKVAVPKELLLRPSGLSLEERFFVQQHVMWGYDLIERLERYFSPLNMDEALFQTAKDVAHFHHENWDGSGYSHGLQGEAIPMAARLVKLADVIDALLSPRPYKAAWPWERVRAELVRLAGAHFDPALVQGLLTQEDAFRKVVQTAMGEMRG